MNRHSTPSAWEGATQAGARNGGRGKRRIARDLVARGLRRRRGLTRAVLSGGAAAAIASVAILFEAAL
ncbi:hypothetical protein [Massilia sp. X63]|jgi:hypothetical protein|uniref:hypothetical protein n=1 Tax=Massilia sp. X63 TaxID=3237285 RepID=UPI0034DD43A9